MESNAFQNQLLANPDPSLLIPNHPLRLKFKPLRYKLKIDWTKPKEGKKRKSIGTRCSFSSSTFTMHHDPQARVRVLHESLKDLHGAKAIRSLEFESPKGVSIRDSGTRDIAKKLRYCSSLQKLKISYACATGPIDKTFENIAQGLKSVPRIKELHLNVKTPYQMTDESLEVLGRRLRRAGGLQKITFENNWITNEGLYYFSRGFRRHTNLRTLNLNFRHDRKIGDEGMKFLSQNLKKCTGIENFCLFLNRSPIVGDIALEQINSCLKKMVNLKKIKLNFRACDRISDIGTEKIFDGFEKLEKLERIWINLRGCDKITDAGVQGLGEKLQGMKALKKLTVKFRGCDKMTDKGLASLMMGIRVMNNGCLENMTLNLSGCKKITNQGLREIWQGLREVSSLKIVQLSLKGLKSITEEEINNMVEDLKVVNPGMKLNIVAENVQIWQGVRL